jgi:hypothetical protein
MKIILKLGTQFLSVEYIRNYVLVYTDIKHMTRLCFNLLEATRIMK